MFLLDVIDGRIPSDLGVGSPDSGMNRQVTTVATTTLLPGKGVPTGWLVAPHAGVGITAKQVDQIIENGIFQDKLGSNVTLAPPLSRPE